ncbi:MAG: diaminopimelate epimerase [Phycisphaerae bacterium]|jgi:diaminopimelate epimerase|nr:diaminopimelate epimerase [Phycisphaerae bacterium]
MGCTDKVIEFCKLSGSGNDFVCIDNRSGQFDDILSSPSRAGQFARTICHRALGLGADGIVFACEPEIEGVADIAARFLEPDGTEANLCGNGTACFIRWATRQDMMDDEEVKILTPAGVVLGEPLDDGHVRVCIPMPEDVQTGLELDVDGRLIPCDFAVTGIEHVVTYVDDIDLAEVGRLGAAIRHHKRFPQPHGVNANFVQVLGEGEIALRTYEYGVEAETLACGTGSAAAAILTAKRFGWSGDYALGKKAVLVHARSGDILRVYFTIDGEGRVTDPCLDTIVRCAYSGEMCGDLTHLAIQPEAD